MVGFPSKIVGEIREIREIREKMAGVMLSAKANRKSFVL
jgi:hypothetical protein